MIIKPKFASRLIIGVGASGAALGFLFITLVLLREGNPYAGFGVIMVGILGFFAYWGARAAVLQANETSLVYRPTVGRQHSVSRAQLASIERISGLKGAVYFSFRSRDGQELIHPDETYSRHDMEALAGYLRVPLKWDFSIQP